MKSSFTQDLVNITIEIMKILMIIIGMCMCIGVANAQILVECASLSEDLAACASELVSDPTSARKVACAIV